MYRLSRLKPALDKRKDTFERSADTTAAYVLRESRRVLICVALRLMFEMASQCATDVPDRLTDRLYA